VAGHELSVPILLSVADALEGLPPHPRAAANLLALSEKALAHLPGAELARLAIARAAQEAGALEPAREVATAVLVETEKDRPTAELALLELGIDQLLLGNLSESTSGLATARAAIDARQSADALSPGRAARARLWEALALSRANKPSALPEAVVAAEHAGVERRAVQLARTELEKKRRK
jgi:hypothetical protein